MADDGKFFDLEIITPDRVFWTGKASMLELNTTEGEVGICLLYTSPSPRD